LRDRGSATDLIRIGVETVFCGRSARKEVAMPAVAVHQVPSLTQGRYEEVVRRLTNGKRRLESPSDLPVEGLLVHFAAETESGFMVVDVFESEEACDRFTEAIRPIAQGVGIEEPPKVYAAHTFVLY
jgi:hypothetical protein